MDYKRDEIKQYFVDYLNDNWNDDCWKCRREDDKKLTDLYFQDDLRDELHHQAFNQDYYIIGTYKAKEWLGDKAMEIVAFIQTYQRDNFGDEGIETFIEEDGFINYERIVNMYTYIIGYEIVNEWADTWEEVNFDVWLDKQVREAKTLNKYKANILKAKYADIM